MNKKRKHIKRQLTAMPRRQLLALAVQKTGLALTEAQSLSRDELVERLAKVESILKPVEIQPKRASELERALLVILLDHADTIVKTDPMAVRQALRALGVDVAKWIGAPPSEILKESLG